ncbi:Tolloid-like protein 2 [Clonorchis sinensis]|uniref:Tolloid-like protein 2 n=1 Tax=Clonorchis sinensis TaxID=79923 RepID=A0A8T1MDD3_CLOSI|nr:Tolloid-like protein 2 [Clonorchis sinensis]
MGSYFHILLCHLVALSVVSADKCEYELRGASGSFASPNYPHNYPNNLNCSWKIHKPNKTSVLVFKDMEIEESIPGKMCQFDFVYVYLQTGSGVQTHGPFCGGIPPGPIKFHDGVTVTFSTDRSGNHRGFWAVYHPVGENDTAISTPEPKTVPTVPTKAPETIDCDYTLNETCGFINSSNYPATYCNNLVCSWLLPNTTEPKKIMFLDFEVEQSGWVNECQYDYLYVYVDTGKDIEVYGPFCGGRIPDPIIYSGVAQVIFVTDTEGTRRGFSLIYGLEPSKTKCPESKAVRRIPVATLCYYLAIMMTLKLL